MSKITLPSIASGFASTTSLNNAFDAIEAEFQDKVLYRDNPSGEPNVMEQDLDMNGNAIDNVTSITTDEINVGGVNLTAQVTQQQHQPLQHHLLHLVPPQLLLHTITLTIDT
jgi:hypothetical protein